MKEKKKTNPRDRMRLSNTRVRKWLLYHKFDQIFFKMHIRKQDTIFTQKGNYKALDLWNLFDGICFDENNRIAFFQVKTNAWAKEKPMLEFHKKYGLQILSFNVKKGTDGKWSVVCRRVIE